MSSDINNSNLKQESRRIALVDDCRSAITDTVSATFEQLVGDYDEPILGKKDGYGYVFADIDEGPRKASRVQSCSYLSLDVEAKAEAVKDESGLPLKDEYGDIIKRVIGQEPPNVDDMVQEVNLWSWRCLLHTTYSHSDGHPRYRLIFVLSRPLLPTELKIFGLYIAYQLGLSDCFDSACLDPARLFYLPRVPSEERKQLYRCVVSEGVPLDVDALLVEARQVEAANEKTEEKRKTLGASVSVIDAFNEQHNSDLILEKHGYLAKGRMRWLWPGSTTGRAGVRRLPVSERVYSSHGGDPLNDGFAHDVFDCYRILDCGGDMKLAVKKAAELMGMTKMPEPFTKKIQSTTWPVDCMPHGMTQAVEAISEHVQAPVSLVGMAVLGAVAHVAMRLVDAKHPRSGAMPASLFILTALESGGRKSACFNMAIAPITKLERALREAHQAKQKSSDESLPDPRTIFMDTTIQKIELLYVSGSAPALSLSTDEGGTLLSGHSMKSETRAALLGTLTKLYDGSGVVRDRVGEGQSGFRFNVRFGVFLSAQPVVLADALNDSLLLDQGFLARFLYTAPTSLAGTRLLEKSMLKSSSDKDLRIITYWNNLELMCRLDVNVDEYGGLVLPMVGMDEEAIGVWLDFYNETELQQRVGGEYAHLKAFASRAGELAVRVAAVYAAWNCAENEVEMKEACVTADDMRRAVALVKFSLDEWLRHSEGTVLNPTELDARDLLEMLHRRRWATATRKLIGQSGPNTLRSKPARRKAAIDELVNRGWLIDENGEFTVVQKPAE